MQIDKHGKSSLEYPQKYTSLYEYKNSVKIPPLSRIDDMFIISKCGFASDVANGTVKNLMESIRLTSKEEIDKSLMQNMLNAPRTTPTKSLYLELSACQLGSVYKEGNSCISGLYCIKRMQR